VIRHLTLECATIRQDPPLSGCCTKLRVHKNLRGTFNETFPFEFISPIDRLLFLRRSIAQHSDIDKSILLDETLTHWLIAWYVRTCKKNSVLRLISRWNINATAVCTICISLCSPLYIHTHIYIYILYYCILLYSVIETTGCIQESNGTARSRIDVNEERKHKRQFSGNLVSPKRAIVYGLLPDDRACAINYRPRFRISELSDQWARTAA